MHIRYGNPARPRHASDSRGLPLEHLPLRLIDLDQWIGLQGAYIWLWLRVLK
jgi:hypothetical protein